MSGSILFMQIIQIVINLPEILCVININTRIHFCKNNKRKCIHITNKTAAAALVLRSFKRILENMKHKAAILNKYGELGDDIKCHIARLYTDNGVELKGVNKKFCESYTEVHI